ncbi:MAG: S24/S26 family peptidase [Clostridia bacterium]|nr:S24/S26 family peptidase [Clostridia bacterium]
MNKSTFQEELNKYGEIVYTNVGDSMEPLIRQGKDLIIIKKADGRLKKYDVPLYRRDNGQYVLHRILKVRKDDYVLCGDNRCVKEYGITDKHIIGVLTAVIRNGKEISVESMPYRIYTYLWCGLFYVRAFVFRIGLILKGIKRKLANLH